jgi:hypothetical protein
MIFVAFGVGFLTAIAIGITIYILEFYGFIMLYIDNPSGFLRSPAEASLFFGGVLAIIISISIFLLLLYREKKILRVKRVKTSF